MNRKDLDTLITKRLRGAQVLNETLGGAPAPETMRKLERDIANDLAPSVQAVWDPNTRRLLVYIGDPKHGCAMTAVLGPAPITIHDGGSTPPVD